MSSTGTFVSDPSLANTEQGFMAASAPTAPTASSKWKMMVAEGRGTWNQKFEMAVYFDLGKIMENLGFRRWNKFRILYILCGEFEETVF